MELESEKNRDCSLCPSRASPGVIVIMDNSNIWIEAKKNAGLKFGSHEIEDPRLRLDIGKLMDVLSKGRTLIEGYIFGSTPPSNDTFWSNYGKKAKCTVITNPRSLMTGAEKQVDTSQKL